MKNFTKFIRKNKLKVTVCIYTVVFIIQLKLIYLLVVVVVAVVGSIVVVLIVVGVIVVVFTMVMFIAVVFIMTGFIVVMFTVMMFVDTAIDWKGWMNAKIEKRQIKTCKDFYCKYLNISLTLSYMLQNGFRDFTNTNNLLKIDPRMSINIFKIFWPFSEQSSYL